MLGKLIAQKRQEEGKTLKALASELNMSPQYLLDIERGNRKPNRDYLLEMIACVLHMSQDYVYYLAGKLPPDIREANASPDEVMTMFKSFRQLLRERKL